MLKGILITFVMAMALSGCRPQSDGRKSFDVKITINSADTCFVYPFKNQDSKKIRGSGEYLVIRFYTSRYKY